jgi:hypothetical protein
MRVVVLVVAVLVIATTSEASSSCMSKGQARRHFGAVHLYWHGADHCWDTTATRLHHRLARNVERDIDQPRGQDFRPQDFRPQDSKPQDASKPQDSEPQASESQTSKSETSKSRTSERERVEGQEPKRQDSKWPDARWQALMPKMMADDEPVSMPVHGSWKDRWVDIKPTELPLAARWVDIAPVTPALSKSAPDPELRMMVLALVFIVIALMLAMVEVLFRAARGPHRRDRAAA